MPTSHYTTVNSLRLRCPEADPSHPIPTPPPIRLLHGFPTSSHLYRNVIPTLAKTHRVIALDLPGHGLIFEGLAKVARELPASETSIRTLQEAERAFSGSPIHELLV